MKKPSAVAIVGLALLSVLVTGCDDEKSDYEGRLEAMSCDALGFHLLHLTHPNYYYRQDTLVLVVLSQKNCDIPAFPFVED